MKRIVGLCLIILGALAFNISSASSTMAKPKKRVVQNMCAIQGMVMKTENWIDQHYGQTPGFFNKAYTRITVLVRNVQIHERVAKGSCYFKINNEETFKLCSPQAPKPGDLINAVSAQLADPTADPCLFDIAVTGNALEIRKALEKEQSKAKIPDDKFFKEDRKGDE